MEENNLKRGFTFKSTVDEHQKILEWMTAQDNLADSVRFLIEQDIVHNEGQVRNLQEYIPSRRSLDKLISEKPYKKPEKFMFPLTASESVKTIPAVVETVKKNTYTPPRDLEPEPIVFYREETSISNINMVEPDPDLDSEITAEDIGSWE